jgi:putative phage-type endonuclease
MENELIQGSPAWLAIRKRCITATDIPVIMGESPFKTPFQLFEEKLGYRIVEETPAMREGTRLEPYARAKLQELFQVELNAAVCFHAHIPWHMASLDAIDEEDNFLCEIKCSKKFYDHSKNYHDLGPSRSVPDHVMPQLQWQMHVTGVDHMYYYAFDGADGILIPIVRDNSYINQAIEKAKEFKLCLDSLEPPPLTPRDIVRREDHEWWQLATDWKDAKMDLKKAELREATLRNSLIELAGESCAEGGGVKVTRYPRKSSIDYKAVPQLKDVDLESYRKPPSVAWRIT